MATQEQVQPHVLRPVFQANDKNFTVLCEVCADYFLRDARDHVLALADSGGPARVSAMVEVAQSEVDFDCQESGYEDEIGDIMSPGVEEGTESEESDADSVYHFHCQGCGYEDDTGFIMCPVCGGGLKGCEEGLESEDERHAESTSTEEIEGLRRTV